MSFGERLYKLRSEKNISQEELAELLDVSRQSISKWENDKAYLEMTKLLFMSDYFGVSLDYLMRGCEGEPKEDNATIYKSNNLIAVCDSFVSNLSTKQRKRMIFLYGRGKYIISSANVPNDFRNYIFAPPIQKNHSLIANTTK